MMKIRYMIVGLLGMLFMISCNDDDKEPVEVSANQGQVRLTANTDNVTALLFVEEVGGFTYNREVNSGWSAEGTQVINLDHGTYKALFYKFTGQNINVVPATLDNTVMFGDIKFDALPENRAGEGEYVLPVNELWLAESSTLANQEYIIPDVNAISHRLTRAVSQVVVHIKQKDIEGEEIPVFEDPSAIDGSAIGEMILDISGVGTSVTVDGATGSASTYYTTTEAVVDESGFITYAGPFVFPTNDVNQNAQVNIVFNPETGIEIPSIDLDIEGLLQRNKKLDITLWIQKVNGNLDVTLGAVVEMDWDESNYVEKDYNSAQ